MSAALSQATNPVPGNNSGSSSGNSSPSTNQFFSPSVSSSSPSTSVNRQTRNTEATILVPITPDQQTKIISYAINCQQSLLNQYTVRNEMEEIDRKYMREKDWTPDQIKSRIANRRGDSTKFQNVTVPIIMPQVNSALTYLMNVFATGYPMFPVTADPSNEDMALQLETIIQENATTAGYATELMMFFRDGLKYNLHALECDWGQKVTWTVGNDPSKENSAKATKVLWNGNVIKRLDLYNSFWDPRVHPAQMHSEGEFAGYTEIYSRTRFKAFCNSLGSRVASEKINEALRSAPVQGALGASTTAPFGYYIPIINPFPFYNKQSGQDWMAWAANTPTSNNGSNNVNAFSVTIMYARILPSDFDLRVPEKNTPQVWKFIIINGQVVLSAERLTNIHGFLPIFFGQPIQDGLDYQTKSFATNVQDMQDVASAMMNSYIASKRRLIGDRVLYDPSRIREKDINSSAPAAKIPVRPSAMGTPISNAVYQFPFHDEQVDSLVQGAAVVSNYANLINGQNPATQGQFVKGNKTRHEYDDVMGHGNGQNQLIAIAIEYQVFVPLKEVMKLNILQYQQEKTIYNTNKGVTVDIDPVDLRKSAVHFKVSDGLIPSDKVTGDDLLQTVIQQLASSEQLAQGFNLAPMFVYLLKTQGLDLTPFAKSPEQMQYEQAMAAWQQASAMAAKTGAEFTTPQPKPSPQLQAQMQQNAKTAGVAPSPTATSLESTQGS